jgi:xanthine dehydrogenase accessory factor
MHEILSDITHWLDIGEPVVMATVVQTWGSSPREVGAKMAFTPRGKITGSVSGGCVEGAVYENGLHTLQTHRSQLLHFGVADETAFEVGLACGGNIDIFVRPLDPGFLRLISEEVNNLRAVAIVSVVEGPPDLTGKEILITEEGKTQGMLGGRLDADAARLAGQALQDGHSQIFGVQSETGIPVRLFADVILPPPTLIMVGGVHISIALSAIARALGYRTIVIDPRKTFSSRERFPHVDQLFQEWPQDAFPKITLTRSTCVVMLTHDPKIDDPALKIVLDSPVFYIGALGSRKTQESRRQRLQADGLTPARLERIHGPVGIDLGAKTPEEIALSVMAEIVAVQRGQNSKY